jgi:hypothetical protein
VDALDAATLRRHRPVHSRSQTLRQAPPSATVLKARAWSRRDSPSS